MNDWYCISRRALLLTLLGLGLVPAKGLAQLREFGVNMYSTTYVGDLTHINNFIYSTRGGIGAHFRRHLSKSLSLRADVNFATLAGSDNSPELKNLANEAYRDPTGAKYNRLVGEYFRVDSFSQTVTSVRDDVNLRNLSFRTRLTEFSVVLEYKFGEFMVNSSVRRANFYVFGGFNVYHYESEARSAIDSIGWIKLKDLTTEGQGLSNFYTTPEYRSTQLGIPLGLGIRWTLDKYTRMSAEAGYRILFTDYLDDVSGQYANPAVIGSVHGSQASEFVDRTRQLHPWLKPNALGSARGNSNGRNDGYLFVGLSISRVIYPYNCPTP